MARDLQNASVTYQNIELHNVAELLEGDGSVVLPPGRLAEQPLHAPIFQNAGGEGLWLSRIPNALRLTLNVNAMTHAVAAAGVELRFNLRCPSASIVLKMEAEPRLVEIWQGAFLICSQVVQTCPTEICCTQPANLDSLRRLTEQFHLPFDPTLTRVLLPWWPPVRLLAVRGECEPPRADQTPPLRYLAYGSSITHGAYCVRPGGSYPMRLAQHLGADLINLGFGGGAHLEPQLAEYIGRRTDWDFATLETGINLRDRGASTFAERLAQFLHTVARSSGHRWVFCTGIYPCGDDWIGSPWVGAYRQIVEQTVRELDHPRIAYVDTRRMMSAPNGLMADLIHPAPPGHEELAIRLAGELRRYLPRCGRTASK